MRHLNLKAVVLVTALGVGAVGYALAQDTKTQDPKVPPQTQEPKRPGLQSGAEGLSLTARLIDKDNMAKQKAAAVQVEVRGISLVDPAEASDGGALGALDQGKKDDKAMPGKEPVNGKEAEPGANGDAVNGGAAPGGAKTGHIHYQIDDGPIVATPVTKLSFHNLPTGSHKINVVLVDSNHKPLGPKQTLDLNIQ